MCVLYRALEYFVGAFGSTNPSYNEVEIPRQSTTQAETSSFGCVGNYRCRACLSFAWRTGRANKRWLSLCGRTMTMALFTLFATIEATILSASWFQRSNAKRTELLHGKETG